MPRRRLKVTRELIRLAALAAADAPGAIGVIATAGYELMAGRHGNLRASELG
jgi:hypothetical protein